MSKQENRVPELIESLTSLTNADPSFVTIENWIHGRLRNHKYLSVNSHEIQRRLENLVERLTFANYEPHSERLTQLCERLRSSALCANHSEADFYWMLMSFLLDVARNPVDALDRNLDHRNALLQDEKVVRPTSYKNTTVDKRTRDLVADLLVDNFIAADGVSDNESVLSDWSIDSNEDISQLSDIVANASAADVPTSTCALPGIKPPAPPEYFRTINITEADEWLNDNAQPSWWIDRKHVHRSASTHPQSQICHYMTEANADLSSITSSISEYCMLREIVWLFSEPVSCKLFCVDRPSKGAIGNVALGTITVAPNVTLNSTSRSVIDKALLFFTHYATIVMRLKNFCAAVDAVSADQQQQRRTPHTYECYALAVRQCLRPFEEFVRCRELELVSGGIDGNQSLKRLTLIRLQRKLEPHTRFLDAIYDVHASSVLSDFVRQPAHICAAHLIAGLLRAVEQSASGCHTNVAGALLMCTLRVYMQIIDTWWTDGRLEDWFNEFVIRNIDHPNEMLHISSSHDFAADGHSPDRIGDDFEMRLLSADEKRSFFVSSSVAETIGACPLIKMLCEHSLQAGQTLNVLHALDRISEMKSKCGYQDNLYETFRTSTLIELHKLKFSTPNSGESISCREPTTNPSKPEEKLRCIAEFRNSVRIGHKAMLASVFEHSLMSMERATAHEDASTTNTAAVIHRPIDDAFEFYEQMELLSSNGRLLLPFGDTILETLSTLLSARIAFANRYVMTMYRDEFHVLVHMRNLRRVFLLEAADLMYQFYTSLFTQMEQNDANVLSWNNEYLLTDQLNGLLCSKYPDMSSLFTVQVSARPYIERNVLDALKNVSLHYAVPACQRDIISDATMRRYNEVFRQLLRIKWGMWTLEQLRFPIDQRRRPPYARLTYHDRTVRRLALVRMWILYSMQCVHSHLMTHVVQVMGERLDGAVARCTTLTELGAVHRETVRQMHANCFLQHNDRSIRMGVEQLLTLILVVRNEWHNLSDANAVDSAKHSQVDEIEISYINCHAYITRVLNTQLYSKDLASLAAAFSCSCPY